jgi:hypothetical protein
MYAIHGHRTDLFLFSHGLDSKQTLDTAARGEILMQ